VEHPVAQHHRPTIQRLTTTHPTRRPGPQQEKLDRPAALPRPPRANIKINSSTANRRVYRWNQAKAYVVAAISRRSPIVFPWTMTATYCAATIRTMGGESARGDMRSS
jgi:hypothetical protein